MTRRAGVVVAALVALALTACLPADVRRLASDDLAGRDNGTPGGLAARAHVLAQLRDDTEGIVPGRVGDAAHLQVFATGANIVGLVRGTTRPDEYVVVGAHVDHLGSACRTSDPTDHVCNGATDNAAGAAGVIELAHRLHADPPARSVLVVLWDAEEDGQAGSRWYVAHPLVPLDRTTAYVNLDLLGANLSPGLRDNVFVVSAETGGPALTSAVAAAADGSTLDVRSVSDAFGEGRSDHAPFVDHHVPSVYLTDSTGPCYHSAQDDLDVLDLPKLEREVDLADRLVRRLATQAEAPGFVADRPIATYDDAEAILGLLDDSAADWDAFSDADRATASGARDRIAAVVAAGPAAFDDWAAFTVLTQTRDASAVLGHQPCDGYLAG